MHSSVFNWVAALCAAGLLLFSQPLTSYAGETQGSGKHPVRRDQTSTDDVQSPVDDDDDDEPIYRNALRRRRPLQRDQTTTAGIQGDEEEEEEEPIYRNVLPSQRRHVSHGNAYRRGHDAGAKSRSPYTDAAGEDEQLAESVYVNIPQGGIQRSRQSQDTEPQPTDEPVYAKVTRKRVSTRGSTRAGGATGHGSGFSLQGKSSSRQLVDSSRPSGHVRPQEDDDEEEEEGEDEGEEIYGVVGLKVRGQGAEVSTTDLPPPLRQGSPEEEERVYSHALHSRSLFKKTEPAITGPPVPSMPLPGMHHIYSEIGGESDRGTAPVASGLPPTSGHPPLEAPEDAFYLKLGGKPKGKSVGHATSGASRPSAQAALRQERNEDIYSRLGARPKGKRVPLAPSGSTQPSVQGPPAEEGASFSKIGGKPTGTEGVFASGSGRREESEGGGIYSEAGGIHRGKPVVSQVHVYESVDPLQNTQSRASPTAEAQPAFTRVAASLSQANAKAPEGKKTSSWMAKLKRVLGVKSARKESQGSPFQTQSESPEGQEDEEGSAVYEEVPAVYEELGLTSVQPEEEPTYAEVKFTPKVPPPP